MDEVLEIALETLPEPRLLDEIQDQADSNVDSNKSSEPSGVSRH
jgi:hypothetical protein